MECVYIYVCVYVCVCAKNIYKYRRQKEKGLAEDEVIG